MTSQRRLRAVLFLMTPLTLVACGSQSRPEDSSLFEGINLANNMVEDMNLSYEAIQGENIYNTADSPWTDSYWPLFGKALARRWGDLPNSGEKAGGILGIADLIQSGSQAVREESLNMNLSPAEKYDILFRYRYGLSLDTQNIQALVSKIGAFEKEADATEAMDVKKSKTSDIYLELFESNSSKGTRSQFPMTTDSLSDYLRYNKSKNYKFLNEIGEGSDWGWMGLCHGWAPAAIMAKTPKSHVVVSLDDKKLILTQGDLRGLLTYSWANYAPRSEFWGTRCNIDVENPASVGPVDTHGRGYTGKIILSDGQEKNFFQIREVRGLVDQRYADAVYNQAMIVKFDDANKTIGVLYQVVRSSTPRNRQQPWELYADTKSLLQTLRKAGSNGTSVKLEIFGCWDTNPATFHTALVEKLGKEKLGFVMDRTQAGQVWNQPVHKAKTVVGKAISIGELSLERLRHITPGTAFVAEVVSEVEWLAEPSDPEMSYTPEFEEDYNHTSKFKYILEFDRRGKMIGGEWGNLESVQPESESGKQQIPDFLFAYKQGQKPHDNLTNGFDYTQIIDKIHACSLDEPTTTIDVAGKAEPAVECTIQKVRPTP